ncbi:Calcipressin-domain-containing protein [Zopfochytrium polystomum]|nr:Calcipressin-domain-containing protein [Zopfochytrium polystomum]
MLGCATSLDPFLGYTKPTTNLRLVLLLPTPAIRTVVFNSVGDATAARAELESSSSAELGPNFRVYYADHTEDRHLNPEQGVNIGHLQVPEIERNFLLSPPGSPPIGWVQSREGGPNPGGHAQALLDALNLMIDENEHEFSLDGENLAERSHNLILPGEADATIPRTALPRFTSEGDWHHPRVAAAAVNVASAGLAQNLTPHVLTFGAPPKLAQSSLKPSSTTDEQERNAVGSGDVAVDESATAGTEWRLSLPIVVIEDHSGGNTDHQHQQQQFFTFSSSDLSDLPTSGRSHSRQRTALPPIRS